MLQISEKLQSYLLKVEGETGRKIKINPVLNVGLQGMAAQFRLHPTLILIEIVQAPQYGKQIEQSIAHEATHGLLAYAKGYCQITPMRKLTPNEVISINLVGTMIEDIVVNKIIQENGFSPFHDNYLTQVRKETKALRKNQDLYQQYQNPFKDRFMVSRYIMAWGFLQYFNLDEASRRTIARFENDFRLSRPKHYIESNQIKEILLHHDIFTAEGYCQAIRESVKLWGLENFVNINPFV